MGGTTEALSLACRIEIRAELCGEADFTSDNPVPGSYLWSVRGRCVEY